MCSFIFFYVPPCFRQGCQKIVDKKSILKMLKLFMFYCMGESILKEHNRYIEMLGFDDILYQMKHQLFIPFNTYS